LGISAWSVAACGLGVGVAVGYAVRRANLCTFGAIESALVGSDWRRMKIFGLALGLAILLTQAMVLSGHFNPATSSYIPTKIAIVSAALGSLMFGLGMALVGTCSFGSLVRFGGGDLRSLIVLLTFATCAVMTLRGAFSPLRLEFLETLAFDMPGQVAGSLIDALNRFLPFKVRWLVTILAPAALIGLVALDPRLRRAPRLLTAGVVLGLGVAAGWLVTGVVVDAFDTIVRVQSLTFVAPVARGFVSAIFGTREWIDFGVTCVIGVVIGAWVAAKQADTFRWEAFDDHHEMGRHLVGAVLMGIGGILAGGCTIGQGITAGSLLAVTWPVTVLGMVLGARLGLAILVDGALRDSVMSMFRRVPDQH
jgi:uncharacterized protein